MQKTANEKSATFNWGGQLLSLEKVRKVAERDQQGSQNTTRSFYDELDVAGNGSGGFGGTYWRGNLVGQDDQHDEGDGSSRKRFL